MTPRQKIRCVLVDDEPPALDELNYLLSQFEDVTVIGTASTAQEGIKQIKKLEPDLVFLDIQMPVKNGFHVLAEVMSMEDPPLAVFATAYSEHAVKAFEENAVDYIMKPVSSERLGKSLERVRDILNSDSATVDHEENLQNLLVQAGIRPGISRICVEDSGKNMLLNPREIIFFHFEDKRVVANTANGAYPCRSDLSLDRLEGRLQGFSFFRTNRSQLVNLSYVRSYAPWFNGKYVLTLADSSETEITVSKNRVRQFKEAVEL
ncbi:MAG: LytR/AlgR family response regulator transcription factor [Desulfovibrio sp.]